MRPAVSAPVKIGGVYKIDADEKNGITPPGGLPLWPKCFVPVGVLSDGSVYGCVVFDSEMNRNCVPSDDTEFFMPVSGKRYAFLDHDSYVDCLKLKPASAAQLAKGKHCGEMLPADMDEIRKLVRMSPRHSYAVLKMYQI